LIEAGYLQNVGDIFTLGQHRDALIAAGLIGKEKNTDKLLSVIEKAKGNPPQRLLTGLGIPNVGKAAAKNLMDFFASLEAISRASEEELLEVADIGPTTAKAIASYFGEEENRRLLQKLKDAGVTLEQERKEEAHGPKPFAGKTFVITGTLPGVSREAAAAFIEAHGGKVTGSVSAKTSFLLAGEEAGSKLSKAQSLNIPVISWEELQSMLT
jgi:DNA ligase (NAD+)